MFPSVYLFIFVAVLKRGNNLFAVTIFPQRYMLGLLGLFALANSFTMRVCLSTAIVRMVSQIPSDTEIVGEICPDPETSVSVGGSNDSTTPITVSRFIVTLHSYYRLDISYFYTYVKMQTCFNPFIAFAQIFNINYCL